MRGPLRGLDVLRATLLSPPLAPALAAAAPVPKVFGCQGRLMRDGAPGTGVVTVQFAVCTAPEGGGSVWSEEPAYRPHRRLPIHVSRRGDALGSDLFDG